MEKEKEFVLIHGACFGSWTWYKLVPLLEEAGHRVTAIDMAGNGTEMTSSEDIVSLRHYSLPLFNFLHSLPQRHKVILVAHGSGGLLASLAAESFPHHIHSIIYVAALLPSISLPPFHLIEKVLNAIPETEFVHGRRRKTILFNQHYLASVYGLPPCHQEIALAVSLMRPTTVELEDSREEMLSQERFGGVKKAYVVCGLSKVISLDFQWKMIEGCGMAEERVVVLPLVDQMAMISSPQQLLHSILQLSNL